jgi:hypothetical protein
VNQVQSEIAVSRNSRRVPRSVVFAASVLFGAAWLYWASQLLSRPSDKTVDQESVPERPRVLVADSLDFGTVWSDEKFSWTIPVTNVTSRRVTITKIAKSCQCTQVQPSSFVLDPGEQACLHLTLNLRTVEQSEQFGVSLYAYESEADGPVAVWHLRGVVKSPFDLQPRKLDFGESLIADEPFRPKSLDVTCYEPCRQIELSVDPSLAAVATNVGDDGRHFQITVAPSQTLRPGLYEFRVGATPVLSNGQRHPPIWISIRAKISRDVELVPSLTHLGNIKVGESRAIDIGLVSRLGRNFIIDEIQSKSTNVLITPRSSSPAASTHFYVVKIRADHLGENKCPVSFHTRSMSNQVKPTNSKSDVILTLQYYGTK